MNVTLATKIPNAITGAFALCLGFAMQASADDGAVKSAENWYEDIYAVGFVEGDPNFYDHYLDHIYLGFGNNVGYHTKESLETEINDYISDWAAAGWEKSEFQSVEGAEIDPQTVMLTARWQIKTAAGEIVTTCETPGWIYIVVASDDTWRVISEFEAPCAD